MTIEPAILDLRVFLNETWKKSPIKINIIKNITKMLCLTLQTLA